MNADPPEPNPPEPEAYLCAYPVNTEPDACQVPWPICPAGCGPLRRLSRVM